MIMTKDSELIDQVTDELRSVDAALIASRNTQKALEGCRDTLRYIRNVLENRDAPPLNPEPKKRGRPEKDYDAEDGVSVNSRTAKV